MLTLNRKEGQAIFVGPDVKIIVMKVTQLPDGRHDVQLGCDGPDYISIDREEVRIRRLKNMDKIFNGNN